MDDNNLEWIHLSFGLGAINPSFGVKYEDLSTILPRESGAQYFVAEMLSSLSGRSYSITTIPSVLASDVHILALSGLERLRNRTSVIERLRRDSPGEWPTFGASARMRLLPLMLAHSGQIADALEWLREHEATAAGVDQQIPKFATYAAHFRARYTV